MLAKRWPQPFCIMVFTALKVKATLEQNPKMFPESSATNTIFTRANNTQLFSSGCNLVAMETADFLTAVLFIWEKSHVLCKTTVGVRKIVYDGLSKARVGALCCWTVWMDEPILSLSVHLSRQINSTNTVLSDEQQKRTLDTVTNQLWRFFHKFTFSAKQVTSRRTFSARGGCNRTLRTPLSTRLGK